MVNATVTPTGAGRLRAGGRVGYGWRMMDENGPTRASVRGTLALLSLLVLAAGCVSETAGLDMTATGSIQPAQAIYRCDEGGPITVKAGGGAVTVDDGGQSVSLPAAPPGQSARFGEGQHVLVAEGGEALWMVAGATPRNCTR